MLSFLGDSSDPDGMRKLRSTWSIVWTDNACCQITSIAAVVFVVALLIKLTGTLPGGRGKPDLPVDPEFASLILAYAVAGILFLSAIVALRVARIRSLFDRGLEIEATVRKVKRFRGGATLKLELQHAGITYRVRSAFQRRSRMPRFDEGTRISVLVDPLNPRRAIPLALYADPGAAPGARVSLWWRWGSRALPRGVGFYRTLPKSVIIPMHEPSAKSRGIGSAIRPRALGASL